VPESGVTCLDHTNADGNLSPDPDIGDDATT